MNSENAAKMPEKVEEIVRFSTDDSVMQFLQLMDELQMIAWQHADQLGLGFDHLQDDDRMWVLARIYVRVKSQPTTDERHTLRTWPVGYDKRQAYRDFLLLNGDQAIAEATSAWAVLESESRETVDMEAFIASHLPVQTIPRNLEFPSRTLPRLKNIDCESVVQVVNNDIDVNGHVNNLNYLRWAVESIPQEHMSALRLATADVIFRAECFAGDELAVRFAKLDKPTFTTLHNITRITDDREVARIQTEWI